MSRVVPRRDDQPPDRSAPHTHAGQPARARLDAASQRWLDELRAGHPRHDAAVLRLHELLQRVAVHELSRRRGQLRAVSGPEFDDLAHQAADDAVVSVLDRLDDFRGLSRFTTWAYKFVVFEISAKVARHAWQRQPPGPDEFDVDLLPDQWSSGPDQRLAQRQQLEALTRAITKLTERQRVVFVAVALNDVSIDVLALELGTNRNAVYKNLFDARRNLRHQLEAAGVPVSGD